MDLALQALYKSVRFCLASRDPRAMHAMHLVAVTNGWFLVSGLQVLTLILLTGNLVTLTSMQLFRNDSIESANFATLHSLPAVRSLKSMALAALEINLHLPVASFCAVQGHEMNLAPDLSDISDMLDCNENFSPSESSFIHVEGV